MDIRLDTKVTCTDGPVGHVMRVVVNADTQHVTHVVVAHDESHHDAHLVPIQHVTSATEAEVALDIDMARFATMEPFFEHEIRDVVRQRPGGQTLQSEGYMMEGSYTPPSIEHMDVYLERVPEGELAVKPGAKVHATDGHVGDVREFMVGDDGTITHIVLREGHLWGRKEVQIPVTEIAKLDEGDVHLKLDKRGIEALPSVKV
jgi:hypothetical protein